MIELHIDPATSRCRVVAGVTRRTFYTTPTAAALALIATEQVAGRQGPAQPVAWRDHLATHGLAIGTSGRHSLTLAVIPPKVRTIRWLSTSLTLTTPPLLLGVCLRGDVFRGGLVFCVNPASLTTLSLGSTARSLLSYPYGNVYSPTGAICWGSASPRDIHSLAEFEAAFFGSGFNTDLYHGGLPRLDALVAGSTGGLLPALTGHNVAPATVVTQLTTFIEDRR